jgi:hypothetical protein
MPGWPREPSHTRSTYIYSPQLKPSCYVHLAQLLRTCGRSAHHGQRSAVPVTAIKTVWNMLVLSEKVKPGRSALLGRTIRDLSTWNTIALVSINNLSGLSAIHCRIVRTWTTYRPAKNPKRSVVQWLKNTMSLPKLNSAYADGPASWSGRSAKGHRDMGPADFSGRVANGPAS